jgi:hypothetical protein
MGSWPAVTLNKRAQSRTLLAKGPTQSKDLDKGITPKALTRDQLGLSPVTPHIAEGCRIEPPVSVPKEAQTSRAATAAPEPLEEPPGQSCKFQGLRPCR